MSTASEQRQAATHHMAKLRHSANELSRSAWRGNRPASMGKAPIPQGRSTGPSPTTPTSAGPKQFESQPLAAVVPAEHQLAQKTTPAPAPAANVWDQRKAAAAQQAKAAPKDAPGGVHPTAAGKDTKPKPTTAPVPAIHTPHAPMNGFNAEEVKAFMSKDSGSYKVHRMEDGGPRPPSVATKATMANGQSFFAQLGKQIAQLQEHK